MNKSALLAGSSIVVSLAFSIALGACDETKAPAPTTSASASATTTTAASASVTVAPTASASAAASGSAAAHSATCEVEIFGTIEIPKDAPKGKAVVYVAQDDCLSPNAQTLGHIPAAPNGSFVIEVWPKWGTDVTICGAIEKEDGTAEWYGKAVNKDAGGVFHAEAEGEVTFNDVKIKLAKGAAKKFPREAKPSGG
jgi:hypothetical protein